MLSVSAGVVGLLAFATPSVQLATPRFANSSNKLFGPLRFKPDGTFQLSIFEDLHFGENAWDSWGPQQDINSVKVLNKILDDEAGVNLVVLNGDLITGENAYKENATAYIDQIVGPIVARDLTWASTYGNHDSDYNISREDILKREQRWPNARTRQMVFEQNSGVSNYYLPVYGSDCKTKCGTGCTPSLLLWFFDSRGGFLYQQKDASGNRVGQPDWVDQSVVDWFVAKNTELTQKYKRVIPSLGFVHIPTNASLALQEKGVDAERQPGINDDYLLAQQAQGWCEDGSNTSGCKYGGQDIPFMQAITSTPGLMAVFSGHDHGDTWCYKWDALLPGMSVKGNGINLCFGQHSGYGGYGNWIRGARQVVVKEADLNNWIVDTYIRLESGDAVGAVTLNSTYGKDLYPVTPDDMTYCPTCNYSIVTPMPGTKKQRRLR
ncbi:Metallo-dependent phosphatase [Thozetella sp. PMI_491]|nr:Metallo-dependent phosphatase [Thozetella sp. PMI_491]